MRHAPELGNFLEQLALLRTSDASSFLEALNEWAQHLERRIRDLPSELPSPEDTHTRKTKDTSFLGFQLMEKIQDGHCGPFTAPI